MCTEKEYVCIDLFVHPCSGGKCLVPPCNVSCWSSGCHWTAFDAVRFGIGSSLWVKEKAPYIESGATESVLPALHKPHVYARTSEFLKVPHCIGIQYACGVSFLLFLSFAFSFSLSFLLFPMQCFIQQGTRMVNNNNSMMMTMTMRVEPCASIPLLMVVQLFIIHHHHHLLHLLHNHLLAWIILVVVHPSHPQILYCQRLIQSI